MAGKQHTINLPGDTQVQVPAWASEDTLERMLLMTQNSNKLADRMLKGAEAITEIDEELVEYLSAILNLTDDKIKNIMGVFNDYSKNATMG